VREGGGEVILRQVAELLPEEYWDENVKKAKEMMKDIPVADSRGDNWQLTLRSLNYCWHTE